MFNRAKQKTLITKNGIINENRKKIFRRTIKERSMVYIKYKLLF